MPVKSKPRKPPVVAPDTIRLTPAQREQLQQSARADAELAYRRKHYAIKYYHPHPKQAAFHASSSLIRLILGGNRSGKSAAEINEAVAHALGRRPWLPPDDPHAEVHIRVPNKGLIVGESFGEQIKKVLVPKLLGHAENNLPGALPTEFFRGSKKNQQGIITHIELTNGSSIDLQSYDQDVSLFESADYDWAAFDEPPPRAVWVAVQRGLVDRKGPSWLAMTPLKEAWIFDELVDRDDIGKFYFDIQDNVGYGLTQEGVDEFIKTLTPDEIETRIHGRFFHLTGLVYKTYGRHNRIARVKIPRHWGLWMHIDTHPREAHRAVWLAVLPDNRTKYVCGAIRNRDTGNKVSAMAEAIKTYEREVLERRGDEIVRLIEPGSSTPNPTQDGLSIRDEFEAHGIFCQPGSKNMSAGILLLQKELQYDPDRGIYPTIFFFEDLDEVHYELTHYVWEEWSIRTAQNRTSKQNPKDKDDHYIEGIHRILLDSPFYPDYNPEEERGPDRQGTYNKVTGY